MTDWNRSLICDGLQVIAVYFKNRLIANILGINQSELVCTNKHNLLATYTNNIYNHKLIVAASLTLLTCKLNRLIAA